MANTEKYTGVIGITSIGLASSLGHDAYNAFAAARAGIVKISELKCLNFQLDPIFGKETMDGFPMVGGHVTPALDGFVGPARAVALGVIAMRDLLNNRPLYADEFAKTAVHLNFSDYLLQDQYAEQIPEEWGNDEFLPSECWIKETSSVIQNILKKSNIAIPLENQSSYYEGKVGVIPALSDAINRIRDGEIDRCIIGGVDSCVEPRFLRAAASLQLLKTADNPVGFLPGEAGCFFLLERLDRCSSRKAQCNVGISSMCKGWDENHTFTDNPSTGNGLAHVAREVLSNGKSLLPGLLILDVNGNERRAADWGHALVKLHREYPIGNLPMWLPVASFGEISAALGVVAICMVVRAVERGYAPGNGSALVCLSSDNGARGAILLNSSNA